jgi:hypothetical protein
LIRYVQEMLRQIFVMASQQHLTENEVFLSNQYF